jgi:Zn-dependent protease with chaperone function
MARPRDIRATPAISWALNYSLRTINTDEEFSSRFGALFAARLEQVGYHVERVESPQSAQNALTLQLTITRVALLYSRSGCGWPLFDEVMTTTEVDGTVELYDHGKSIGSRSYHGQNTGCWAVSHAIALTADLDNERQNAREKLTAAVQDFLSKAISEVAASLSALKPSASQVAAALPSPAASSVAWKHIRPGRTTRADVEKRFGTGRSSGYGFIYTIDAIPALVAYEPDNRVRSIKLPTAMPVYRDAIVKRCGSPEREEKSSNGRLLWQYVREGEAFEFAPDGKTIESVELSLATASADQNNECAALLVPVRPPLTQLSKRRAEVEAALNLPSGAQIAADEADAGKNLYQALVHQSLILNDPLLQGYMDGVMGRITSVTPEVPFSWTVAVVDSPEPNAMNIGGGVVLIIRGLLVQLDTEAQLAFVLAHETGHQLKGHLAAQRRRQVTMNVLAMALGIATGVLTGQPGVANAAASLGSGVGGAALSPFNRAEESEADLIALHILKAAGYDPRAAADAMEKLTELQNNSGGTIAFFSTHPDPAAWLADINGWLKNRSETDFSTRLVTTQEFAEVKEKYHAGSW